MFRYFYYRYIRYGQEFKNPKGISIFAGYCMDSLTDRTIRKGLKIKENIGLLEKKKGDLTHRRDEITKFTILENDEYYSLRRRIRTGFILLFVLVLAEFGLNYFTTFIILGPELKGLTWSLIRLALALSVTVMAIISSERFLEEILPKKKYAAAPKQSATGNISIPVMILWFLCLAFVEWAIYNFGLLRAHDFESGSIGPELTRAMIILSMIIPVVAGGVGWDIMNYYDAYKNRRLYDNIIQKLNKIGMRANLLKERKNNYFQKECTDYWHTFNVLKTYKENYNIKRKISEGDLAENHFAKDFDKFKKQALNRYNDHIEKQDAITKLDELDTEVGKKIGQTNE